MAWLQVDPSGNYHICFRFAGRKFKRSLRTKSEREANARLHRLEENARLVESGRIDVPEEADIPTLLLSDGKVTKKTKRPTTLTLRDLLDSFFKTATENLEETTIHGMKIHSRHLKRHIGDNFPIPRIGVDDLQEYVRLRSKDRGVRGRTVGAATINKELVTLRCVWNWGKEVGKIKGEFPRNGLRLPKTTEKPPFQTWSEIERKIARGGLSDAERAELWDCLFLTLPEIGELLKHVKKQARHAFIYPMFVFAAHTGARRSEITRP